MQPQSLQVQLLICLIRKLSAQKAQYQDRTFGQRDNKAFPTMLNRTQYVQSWAPGSGSSRQSVPGRLQRMQRLCPQVLLYTTLRALAAPGCVMLGRDCHMKAEH